MLPNGLDKLLQEEIETLLSPLRNTVCFYGVAKEPLIEVLQDSIKGTAGGRDWFLLPLLICDTLGGHWEKLVPACAGLELLKASAEVFDDIEDADSVESISAKYGVPIAINAASTLLILAERALISLGNRGVESERIISLLNAVNAYYTTASMGQHMDLSLTPEESASEDIYLNVISMKSASVIECACYVGAFLANTNQALVESFALFGNNLGMAGQIANDIKSVINMRDIKKGKITLPAIYALAQTDGEIHDFLKNQFFNRPVRKLIDPNRTRDLLYNTGAIHYSTIKMELYKQKAADILIELERSGIRVGQLKQFLD